MNQEENQILSENQNPPKLLMKDIENNLHFKIEGDLLISTIEKLENETINLKSYLSKNNSKPLSVSFDFSNIQIIDSAGALFLKNLVDFFKAQNIKTNISNYGSISSEKLIKEIETFNLIEESHKPENISFKNRIKNFLIDIGKEISGSLNFIGATVFAFLDAIKNPGQIRWLPVFSVAETAGINAIPIIMVLTFFIGAVISFMGVQILSKFGASVFTIDLLGISILREFAVLITSVLIAGRSASAFAAQIGSMKMNQEIDAMSIIGIDTMKMLVLPRVLALLIMLPILTFFAIIAGLVGGGLVCLFSIDMSLGMFLSRLQTIDDTNFWTGMAKAPIFAIIIAIIGCRHGLMVGNDVISLGKNTTSAVVQSIFMVIIVDAIFAIIYYEIGI